MVACTRIQSSGRRRRIVVIVVFSSSRSPCLGTRRQDAGITGDGEAAGRRHVHSQDINRCSQVSTQCEQWCSGQCGTGRTLGSPLSLISSYPPLLSLPNCPSLPSFLNFLPLEVGALNPAMGQGERCKLPLVGWGRASAEIEFSAF